MLCPCRSEFRREIEQNKKPKVVYHETQSSVSNHQGPSTSYQVKHTFKIPHTSMDGSTSTSFQTQRLPSSFQSITHNAANPSDTSISRLPTIKPYVRKRGLGQPSDMTTEQGNTSMQSDGLHNIEDTEHLGRVIKPYKRKRVISKTSPSGSLLETGLESKILQKHSPEESLGASGTNNHDNSTMSMDAVQLCGLRNDILLGEGTVIPNLLKRSQKNILDHRS